jgi:hypothetical protein
MVRCVASPLAAYLKKRTLKAAGVNDRVWVDICHAESAKT